MTAYNTKGLTEAQIEPVARLVMAGDRLYWLIPFLIGFWLNAMLFGVLVVLFVRWQGTVARTDKVWVKGIVYYLFILHCGATVYSMLYSEYMFVAGFGRYRNLINPSWARPSWVLGACSRIPCSAFFTHRAWVMYRRHWSVPVCVVPMFLGSAACAFAAVGTFEYMPLPVITRQLFMGMTALSLASDVSLTALLAFALMRSRTGFEHTNQLIGQILRTLIETQSPPTIVAALQFIVTAKWGDTSQVAYFHAAPRLYPICLLMILNSRNTYIHMTQRNVYMPHSGESASQSEDLTMRSKEGGIMVDRVTHVTVQDWAPYPFVRRSVNRDNLSLPPDSSLSEDGGEDAKEVDVKVDETV